MPLTSIRLRTKHRHAGREYAAGTLLQVKQSTADWLVEQGVAVYARGGPQREQPVPALLQGGASAPVRTASATAPAPVKRRGGCCGWNR